MDLNSKFHPKTPNLFYTKPYINCEDCLHAPLKCRNCLMAMMHRRKITETPKIHLIPSPIPKGTIEKTQFHRAKKPQNIKYSLKDAIGAIPKTRKKEEEPLEIKYFLDNNQQTNNFFPKLPQKIFNHKYLMLPEGKRKILPNLGTGTEVFIKMKENMKRRKNYFQKRRNEEPLFYREKYFISNKIVFSLFFTFL